MTELDLATAKIRIAYSNACARNRDRYFLTHPRSATDVQVIDLSVRTRDGKSITLRLYSPEGRLIAGVAVYIHGGGWRFGDLNSEDASCRRLSADADFAIVSIDYRLVPENPYPTPLNDVHDALLHILSPAFQLYDSILEKGYILVGSSAGAHLATILSLLARDLKIGARCIQINPKGLLLRCPVTVHPECVPKRFEEEYRSWRELNPVEGGIALTKEKMSLCHDMLAVPVSDRNNPHAYPLHTTFTSSLPKTYIQKCTDDILHDDSQCYIIGLQEAGVEVKQSTYKGNHTFWLKKPEWEDSQKAEEDMVDAAKWLYGLG